MSATPAAAILFVLGLIAMIGAGLPATQPGIVTAWFFLFAPAWLVLGYLRDKAKGPYVSRRVERNM